MDGIQDRITETLTWVLDTKPNDTKLSCGQNRRFKRASVALAIGVTATFIEAVDGVAIISLVHVEALEAKVADHGRVLEKLCSSNAELRERFEGLRNTYLL